MPLEHRKNNALTKTVRQNEQSPKYLLLKMDRLFGNKVLIP